jgi:hypothetical protein
VSELYARRGIASEWTGIAVLPCEWRTLLAEGALAERPLLELMTQMVSSTREDKGPA